MSARGSKLCMLLSGAIILPFGLRMMGADFAVFILAPAMFWWLTLPMLVVMLVAVGATSNSTVRTVGQHISIAFGGLLATSTLLLLILALR